MALELIGGSILSPVIQVLVDRLASRDFPGFFRSYKLDGRLLEKLNETLNTVNGLLDDAEEKQITKPAVKNWLNDVKHAVYEAEDILEEIDYEYLRSKDIDRPDSNWKQTPGLSKMLYLIPGPSNRSRAMRAITEILSTSLAFLPSPTFLAIFSYFFLQASDSSIV
ncbi:disease resistance RPP13-like protein 1 isoform X2 [Populus alba x Populus x berolinensis]|uniref:Disease resistance RPP13-like protein 1 isoform X2 n=1 Tax=Populus alba x Populus x berolinensis TaxID=444605 RepID=A0AAD6LE34_9ROSI|nr:disease resistance RPP13-like protein 1 isoform X2 [Populus alba x Populus x berolinensis]